jgi:hypothetical protein
MWEIDVIGPVNPKASNGHRFILVVINYFTKWVEAGSFAHVTQKVVKKFIERFDLSIWSTRKDYH